MKKSRKKEKKIHVKKEHKQTNNKKNLHVYVNLIL